MDGGGVGLPGPGKHERLHDQRRARGARVLLPSQDGGRPGPGGCGQAGHPRHSRRPRPHDRGGVRQGPGEPAGAEDTPRGQEEQAGAAGAGTGPQARHPQPAQPLAKHRNPNPAQMGILLGHLQLGIVNRRSILSKLPTLGAAASPVQLAPRAPRLAQGRKQLRLVRRSRWRWRCSRRDRTPPRTPAASHLLVPHLHAPALRAHRMRARPLLRPRGARSSRAHPQ